MALLQANTGGGWYDLPTPKPNGYYPSYTHLENSFRDARGYLHRDIVRKNTARVECSWNALNNSQIRILQQLYDYNSFYLRFTDCYGNRVEKLVYAGPLNVKVNAIDHNTDMPTVLTDVSMNFVEY